MPARRRVARRAPFFWLLLSTATVLLTLEPALFLVLLALALSGVAVTWIVLLAKMLLLEAWGTPETRAHCVLPGCTDSATPAPESPET